MEVETNVTLLNVTDDPGPLVEDIASISYQTQRFYAKKHPRLVKFASGRVVSLDELGLEEDPEAGKPLPGYSKDDVYVAEVIPATWERVVKFLLAIGHHNPFECCHATFLLENITRKASLHLLRYKFCVFNMQSQKYRDQGSFEYLLPPVGESPPGTRRMISNMMGAMQGFYEELRKTGIDPEWSRCVYPNNAAQAMTMSADFRQWRHIFDCLCDDDYVPEDRFIMMKILRVLQDECPVFFDDYIVSDDGRSAKRRNAKYARNKKVNWSMSPEMKREFGLEVPGQIKGEEVDIP